MACTTILVGKKASYDGSTMIARNDDSPSGAYMPKKFVVIHPEDQPKVYESVISHVKIELPENPMRYTAMPNAVKGEGIWAASGVNEAQVGMTATETITSNPRVLGADPLVTYQPKSVGHFLRTVQYMPVCFAPCSCVCSRLISPSVSSWHKQDNTSICQSGEHIQHRTPYNS